MFRRNREEREGQYTLPGWDAVATLTDLKRQSRAVDEIADDSPEAIHRKRQLFESSHKEAAWLRQKHACDLWTAAFFQPLTDERVAITSATLAKHLAGQQPDPRVHGHAAAIANHQRFFHWPLEFPEVFADGGFDAILSNPPWERVKLQEQEFFAARDSEIALAPNKAARNRLIRERSRTNPELHREFVEALRGAAAASSFMRHAGRFPLAGRGDINTYAVFAEIALSAINSHGRAGMVLPKGIATDDTTKLFFSSLVKAGRLINLIGFENEEFIFPAVDHRVTFCIITLGGGAHLETSSRIAFYIRRFSQLSETHRFFTLDKSEFWLLNPNTGNCPVFRSQADAELTKAIYRRVPALWREATDDQPEVNPWRLSFSRLFDMSNDSHHFRTAAELEADGYRREGNVFVSPYDRFLPLYEAKMLHQFDHRFSTYEGATEKQLNVGILPQPSAEQKRDPFFVVQPRYWVREEVVESAIPKYPEPLALALQAELRPSIQGVLVWWTAGYYLNRGDRERAGKLLDAATRYDLDRSVARWLGDSKDEDLAATLEQDFPLTESDAQAITQHLNAPEDLARELVERFSPKWFLGWRDICRSTDQRTLICGVVPKAAVGHKFMLMLGHCDSARRLCLETNLNSLAVDYCARQKLGGTSFSYFVIRQLPVMSAPSLDNDAPWTKACSLANWIASRALELTYTAHDLAPLARDCGYNEPPFTWDEARRFEIRCELDAAFFHLYLPCEPTGAWQRAESETPEQLAALQKHFPTPRDAAAFILDQFPIVRQKDEQAHGRYRTKERILEIYDALLAAQRSGRPYQSFLNPPPGTTDA